MAYQKVLGEFAINPVCIESRSDLRDLTNVFGFEHGAVISNFPNGWHRLVASRAEKLAEPDKSSFLESLRRLKDRAIAHIRPSEQGPTWFDQAVAANAKHPFHAVLTDEASELGRLYSEAIDDTKLRKGLREAKVPRRPVDLIASFLPLVVSSDRFTIIDPYLAPDDYYVKFMQSLVEARRTRGNSLIFLDLHIEFCSDPDELRDASQRCKNMFQTWGHSIGQNLMVNVYWWDDYGVGELHPRYLLSEKGGVRLDRGARIPPDLAQQNHDTDISMLTDEFVKQIECRYSGTYQPLKLKDKLTFRI